MSNPNAWLVTDPVLGDDDLFAKYIFTLKGERSLYQAIAEDDWILILNTTD